MSRTDVDLDRVARAKRAERFNANGQLIRGQTSTGIYRDVDRLIDYCQREGLRNLAMAFQSYEAERVRLHKAIENLENQLTEIADKHREHVADHGKLVGILKRADIDPETIMQTDVIFGTGGTP